MKKFGRETNGYNRTEVNKFLGDIVKETDELVEKYKLQKKRIKFLEEEIKNYENIQLSIKDEGIQEESNHIIKKAKEDASEIINEALKEAEKVEKRRKLLERNMELFKKKLRLIVDQQHIIIDKIDELEIEDK